MIKVLVVDDSALMRRVLVGVLAAQSDMQVTAVRSGAEALARLQEAAPDVITLDVQMPDMDGLACLDRIMVERPTRVVMVSSLTTAGADAALEAMALGAVDAIAKPEGAISLALESFGPTLVERVRAAAQTRLRISARLGERIRLRTRSTRPWPAPHTIPSADRPPKRALLPGQTLLVGTSTGGPPALEALLRRLPADFPWPIVIAQHMPASFTASLARRLDRLCALHVMEVDKPMPIAPGTVHIGKGDADLIIGQRPGGPVVMAAPSDPSYRWHPSVDRLVETAMTHIEPARLVGLLMTGMGNDGAAAMTRLRQAGGRTIAEAEETAIVWGMPGELARAGGAEAILPLDAIAGTLLEWAA